MLSLANTLPTIISVCLVVLVTQTYLPLLHINLALAPLCVFLGYSSNHKGFWCLDLSSNRIIVSRHVILDESSFPFAKTPSPPPANEFDFLLESEPQVPVLGPLAGFSPAGTPHSTHCCHPSSSPADCCCASYHVTGCCCGNYHATSCCCDPCLTDHCSCSTCSSPADSSRGLWCWRQVLSCTSRLVLSPAFPLLAPDVLRASSSTGLGLYIPLAWCIT